MPASPTKAGNFKRLVGGYDSVDSRGLRLLDTIFKTAYVCQGMKSEIPTKRGYHDDLENHLVDSNYNFMDMKLAGFYIEKRDVGMVKTNIETLQCQEYFEDYLHGKIKQESPLLYNALYQDLENIQSLELIDA